MLFLRIMLTEFIAEMGDKTQLMLLALTSRYRVRDILLGTAAAILCLNGIAVLAGGLVSKLVPEWMIKLAAAAAFLYFAFTSLKEDDGDEGSEVRGNGRSAAVSVFLTFFAAELGDKTQLTAITFGANEGMGAALTVWLACSAGLFAADLAGVAAGILLKDRFSGKTLKRLAFCIFTGYGILTGYQAFQLLL